MATPIDLRDRAVLLLLATTGIRNGELRALQLRDIDWRSGQIFSRAICLQLKMTSRIFSTAVGDFISPRISSLSCGAAPGGLPLLAAALYFVKLVAFAERPPTTTGGATILWL
jgi:hypothetical protein